MIEGRLHCADVHRSTEAAWTGHAFLSPHASVIKHELQTLGE